MKKEVISKKVKEVPKRKTWGFNPITRITKDKKKYSRKGKAKKNFMIEYDGKNSYE